jgi:hypothetical protein
MGRMQVLNGSREWPGPLVFELPIPLTRSRFEKRIVHFTEISS